MIKVVSLVTSALLGSTVSAQKGDKLHFV